MVVAKEYEPLIPVLPGLTHVHVFDRQHGLRALRTLRRSLSVGARLGAPSVGAGMGVNPKEKYDYVLDLHNVLRTRILRRGLGRQVFVINKRTFRRWLLVRFKLDFLKQVPDIIGRYFETAKALGVTDDGPGPSLTVERLPPSVGARLGAGAQNRIAIAPGARHWNKRWPAEYFREVARTLIERGFEVVFYGSQAERGLIEEISSVLPSGNSSVVGETDLGRVARSLATCSAAITNDSGLMHLATAVGTPVVALFGPTVKQFGFAPRASSTMHPDSVVLEVKGLYCRPCTAIGLDHCPETHFRCMKEIGPERVIESVGQAWSLALTSNTLQETRS
jgi:lipopolysaccharide heptosyltransferase II